MALTTLTGVLVMVEAVGADGVALCYALQSSPRARREARLRGCVLAPHGPEQGFHVKLRPRPKLQGLDGLVDGRVGAAVAGVQK